MISIGEVITARFTFKNIQIDNSNDFEWFIEKMSNMNGEVKEINKIENEDEDEIKKRGDDFRKRCDELKKKCDDFIKSYEGKYGEDEDEVEVEDELEEKKFEEQRRLQIEKDKEDTKKMEEENKKRCDDFKKRYEEQHGEDCDTLEPIKITYEDINNKIENGISFLTHKPFTVSTKKSYKNCMKNIHKHFNLDDYTQLLKEPKLLIDYIYKAYDKDSTKKNHLSCLLFLIKSFCPNDDNEIKITDLNKILLNNLTTQRSNKMDEGKQYIGKAYGLMAFMKEQKNNIFAHMVLNYGVLRPDELYNMKVLDEDNDEDNYINVETQTMVINRHKTIKNYGVKRIKLDDKFIDMVYEKLGGHVFTNLNNEPYQTGKGLTDMIVRQYGCTIYDIRKMKTSIVLKDGNEVEREKLAKFQGHDVSTMVSYYKTYN